MKPLHSLLPVLHVIPTAGSKPLLISANDNNEYVCKYVRNTPATKLAVELISSHFASSWSIFTPQFKLIKVREEHITAETLRAGVTNKCFEIPLTGTLYFPFSRELDLTTIKSWKQNPKQIKQIVNRYDYLKAALFDLWLANEDRNHNNYNVLVSVVNGKQMLNFIDYEKCFNSGNLLGDYPLYEISESETLLNTEVLPLLYPKQQELENDAGLILNRFGDYLGNCGQEMSKILEKLPKEWGIEREEVILRGGSRIFGEKWVTLTGKLFKAYLETGIRNFY